MKACSITSTIELNLKPEGSQSAHRSVRQVKMQSPMVPLNTPQGRGTGPGTVVSMPEHPPDYAVWSIATFIYGNPFCLGLIALICSMKVSHN